MSTHTTTLTAEHERRATEYRQARQQKVRNVIDNSIDTITSLLGSVIDHDTDRDYALSAVVRRHPHQSNIDPLDIYNEWTELDQHDPRWLMVYRTLSLDVEGYGDEQLRRDICTSLGKIAGAIERMDFLVGEEELTDQARKKDVRREMRTALDDLFTAFDAWSRAGRQS